MVKCKKNLFNLGCKVVKNVVRSVVKKTGIANRINRINRPKNSPRLVLKKSSKVINTNLTSVINEELYEKAKENQREVLSFVYSPMLLQFLLIFLSMGARNSTLLELNQVMKINADSKMKEATLKYTLGSFPRNGNLQLEFKNFIFVNGDLEMATDFKWLSLKYGIAVRSFTMHNESDLAVNLNKIMKNDTKKHLTDVFDASDFVQNNPSVIIASSIYYKNKWLFPPLVQKQKWNITTASGVYYELQSYKMTGTMKYVYIPDRKITVVEIPYVSNNTSMLIFLPDRNEDLHECENYVIQNEDIINYLKRGIMKDVVVEVSLPRFSIESMIILPEKLGKIGINRLFNETAELDGMIYGENARITNFIQRVKLWGHEGRGAYEDYGDEESYVPEVTVIANHSFFFVLKMNDMALMMGRFVV